MGVLSVLAAAAAAWVLGAVWYVALSKPWLAVSGAQVDSSGRPLGGATPFVLSAVAMVLVAGMMRHTFGMAGVDTVAKGLVSGLGVGAFFVAPWIAINNAYPARPFLLTLIDGGYAILGCALMGLVLMLF